MSEPEWYRHRFKTYRGKKSLDPAWVEQERQRCREYAQSDEGREKARLRQAKRRERLRELRERDK